MVGQTEQSLTEFVRNYRRLLFSVAFARTGRVDVADDIVQTLLSMYSSRLGATGADLDALTEILPVMISKHLAAREAMTAEYGAEAVSLAVSEEEPEGSPTLATMLRDAKVQIALFTPQAEAERELYDRASEPVRQKMESAGLSIVAFFTSKKA